MPQMGPMLWLVYPFFLVLVLVMNLITLCKEEIENGSVKSGGELKLKVKKW